MSHYCEQCGYDLAGHEHHEPMCPECGHRGPPVDPKPVRIRRNVRAAWRVLCVPVLAILPGLTLGYTLTAFADRVPLLAVLWPLWIMIIAGIATSIVTDQSSVRTRRVGAALGTLTFAGNLITFWLVFSRTFGG